MDNETRMKIFIHSSFKVRLRIIGNWETSEISEIHETRVEDFIQNENVVNSGTKIIKLS